MKEKKQCSQGGGFSCRLVAVLFYLVFISIGVFIHYKAGEEAILKR